MENKIQLIDVNALKDRFKLRINWLEKDKHDEYTTGIWDGCLYDAKLIDEAPIVDAVPVVHSRWKFNTDGSGTCENCHFTQRGVWDYDNHQHYCGVCGACMDEEIK